VQFYILNFCKNITFKLRSTTEQMLLLFVPPSGRKRVKKIKRRIAFSVTVCPRANTRPTGESIPRADIEIERKHGRLSLFGPGLQDFPWCNIPKRKKYTSNYHKIYQMAKNIPNGQKHTKWPKNIPNGQKHTKLP
jgi:hypothetical protein